MLPFPTIIFYDNAFLHMLHRVSNNTIFHPPSCVLLSTEIELLNFRALTYIELLLASAQVLNLCCVYVNQRDIIQSLHIPSHLMENFNSTAHHVQQKHVH